MKTEVEPLKTFEIFKNSAKDCLKRSNNKGDSLHKKVSKVLPRFPRKQSQLKKFRYSKICKKSEKCHFATLRTFVFDVKVASKAFSKNASYNQLWI